MSNILGNFFNLIFTFNIQYHEEEMKEQPKTSPHHEVLEKSGEDNSKQMVNIENESLTTGMRNFFIHGIILVVIICNLPPYIT